MQVKCKNVLKLILIILILATLSFIFVQSMIPREESGKQSDAVGDIVADIVPPETKPGAFLQINIRKVAHFIEFALLGAEVSLYVLLFMRRGIFVYLSLLIAPLPALVDETVQIYSGRGPSMKDVMIDSAGFLSAAVIFYTVYAVACKIRKNVNKNSQKQTVK